MLLFQKLYYIIGSYYITDGKMITLLAVITLLALIGVSEMFFVGIFQGKCA